MHSNTMRTLIFIVLLVLPYVRLSAEPLPSLEKMSRAEYEKLPEKTRDQLPAVAEMKFFIEKASNDELRALRSLKSFIVEIEDYLYDLRFYPYLPQGKESSELTAAIKDFQKSIGAAQTGILLVKEHIELVKRVHLYHLPRFSSIDNISISSNLPFYSISRLNENDVKVSNYINRFSNCILVRGGTWKLHGVETTEESTALHSKKYIFKIPTFNISQINCDKKDMLCTEVISQLDNDQYSILYWLENKENLYSVIKWSDTEIIAEHELAKDYNVTLIINIPSKNVHRITRYVSTDRKTKKNNCPRIEELVSSSKFFASYGKKIGDIKTTSPAYQHIKISVNSG